MKILGFYQGHTASASLTIDGKVHSCVSEERFTGVKNQTGFPHKSIDYVLASTNLKPSDVDYVVIPQMYSSPIHISQTAREDTEINTLNLLYGPLAFVRSLTGSLSLTFPELRDLKVKSYDYLAKTIGKFATEKEKTSIARKLGISKSKVLAFEHHLAHAASAYYGSPYNQEKCLVLTLDGEGDTICSSVNIFDQANFTRIASTTRDNSLGLIYMYLTGYLGMKMTEHEYKVMGLAPYAKEQSTNKLFAKISDWVILDPVNRLQFKSKFHTDMTLTKLEQELRGERFDNIAAAFQRLLEERVVEWVKEAIAVTGLTTLCLSGGVFMNVKLNQKIMELPEVQKVFVMPSCGDESSIIGASYLCELNLGKNKAYSDVAIEPLQGMYFGPDYSNDIIKAFIDSNNLHTKYKVEFFPEIEKEIAKKLKENKVVGRLSGRMEFGARALGNRSILANPSDQDVVMIINEQMKDRDFWMPFAPSILREREHDYIVNPKNIDGRYMIMAFDSTDLTKKEMRAALHPYDFTCRPQIVDKKINPKYHQIIKEFENLTGIGAVLNTSFNLHGFPIVLGPAEALHAFEHSGLAYLALENYLIAKE